MVPPTNAASHSRDILPILRSAEAWDAGSTSETCDPETLPDRGLLGIESETTQTGRLRRPACNALLTGSSFEGGANPTNSGLFRGLCELLETTHCMQTAARRNQFSATILETRFSIGDGRTHLVHAGAGHISSMQA